MLNRIVLIGRLTRDPELSYTPQGTAVTSFRLAVDRQFSSRDGERQTDFIDIVCWRNSAEFAANYLTKGRLVAVEGRLQIREWVAQNLQALDKPRQAGDGGGGYAPAPQDEAGQPDAEGTPDFDAYDDPFQEE